MTPDEVVEEIIRSVWRGDPAVVVPSPPGSGKSSTIERAVYAIAHLSGRRVAVACNTNAQVIDLVSRTARAYPDLRLGWIAKRGVDETVLDENFPNVEVVNSDSDLDSGVEAVFATTSKWQWVDPGDDFFADLLIVDEAWQCPDVMFAQISCLAPRYLLVGDPGQIAPVTTVDVTRWRHRSDGPHRPAPEALLERQLRRGEKGEEYPVTEIALPATRRFGQDTTDFIQPAFYPSLPFKSIRPKRYLRHAGTPSNFTGALLGRLGENHEVVVGELPFRSDTQGGFEMAKTIASITRKALQDTVVVGHSGNERRLKESDVGVVCAHIADVTNVLTYLSVEFPDVWVDTAERWQGAERELMIVWDPLAGKTEITDFGRDSGRMCVMLSRHRCGCVLLTRQGVGELLSFAAAGNDRVLSDKIDDPSHSAWRAQTLLRDALVDRTIRKTDFAEERP